MRQIVADMNDAPVIRISCPGCGQRVEQSYALSHGEKLRCEGCGDNVLFTFYTEVVAA